VLLWTIQTLKQLELSEKRTITIKKYAKSNVVLVYVVCCSF